jgi:hypothetical protein
MGAGTGVIAVRIVCYITVGLGIRHNGNIGITISVVVSIHIPGGCSDGAVIIVITVTVITPGQGDAKYKQCAKNKHGTINAEYIPFGFHTSPLFINRLFV